MIKSKVLKEYRDYKLKIHDQEVLEKEAVLAVAFVERWGAVAAMTDGEDSSGRQKLRLMTPDELTDRALECSTKLFEKIRKKGLVHITEDLIALDEADKTMDC